jgi:rare lipoprotein A
VKNFFLLSLFILFYNCTVMNVANIAKDELSNSNPDNISSLIIEPPYEINGKWFYPKNYESFSQIGVASKIRNLEVGSRTSNGERYHPDVLSGAHASLALPSMISVTNLSNGYTANVRINHRGGYSNINTIELSPSVFNILEINSDIGIVEINLINQNETFVLKEAKTYNAEKRVNKAPVSSVSLETIASNGEQSADKDSTLSNNENNDLVIKEVQTGKIYLNITKFSFKRSAISFKDGFKSDLNINIIESKNGDKIYYNVVLGPFDDIEDLYNVQKDDTFKHYEDLSLLIL